jgi:hypothetical protein
VSYQLIELRFVGVAGHDDGTVLASLEESFPGREIEASLLDLFVVASEAVRGQKGLYSAAIQINRGRRGLSCQNLCHERDDN